MIFADFVKELGSELGSAEFWLSSSMFLAVMGVIWNLVGRATSYALFWLTLKTKPTEFTIPAQGDHPPEIHSVRCLFIRYGNDSYLQDLASDEEKHHGRLRNEILPVTTELQDDGSLLVRFKLRIHKRLGTQFKMFVEVVGDEAPVIAYLKGHETIADVGVSSRPGKKRVFFTLRDFPVVKTIEGFENNMIWPV